jgi:hypothetical protein
MTAIYIIVSILLAYGTMDMTWAFIRRRRGVIYQGQVLGDLGEHFDHFLMRGFPYAEFRMHIENTEHSLRVRKVTFHLDEGYEAFVIFDGATESKAGARRLRHALVRSGFKGRCKYGTKLRWSRDRYKDFLICSCQSPEEVVFVIKKALVKLYELPEDITFTMYVSGGMEDGYLLRDSKTTWSQTMKPLHENRYARPYLKHQIGPHEKYKCGPKGEHPQP